MVHVIVCTQVDDPELEGSAKIHDWLEEVNDMQGEVHSLETRTNEISIDSLVCHVFWC
jgi:hypothetical protein